MQLIKNLSLLFLAGSVHSFTVIEPNNHARKTNNPSCRAPADNAFRLSPLFMGRAAAVRAATKSKTDAKKAKTNAVFGKKIIMAVKQGGSADPNANRMLFDIIKQAKSNSVPMDVSEVKTLCFLDFLGSSNVAHGNNEYGYAWCDWRL
mgnify:CR=1 FL=1